MIKSSNFAVNYDVHRLFPIFCKITVERSLSDGGIFGRLNVTEATSPQRLQGKKNNEPLSAHREEDSNKLGRRAAGPRTSMSKVTVAKRRFNNTECPGLGLNRNEGLIILRAAAVG